MDVLPILNEVELSPIRAVPGLYVSSLSIASFPERLSSEGITHIIRVVQDRELLRKPGDADWSSFKVKQVPIDDDGDEDILVLLDDLCQWIEDALHPSRSDLNDLAAPAPQNRVLVHCRQGMSRSGAIVIAYLMKHLSIPYSMALTLVRQSRPIITPNPGFERQLRIWEHCRYDIYLPPASPSPLPASSPGPDKVDRQLGASNSRPTKAAYNVWKKERDGATMRERETRRVGAMANAAAEFGRRRLAAQDARKATSNEGGLQAGNEAALKKQRQWDRVKEMEKAWNDKLIRGEVQRAKEEGNLGTLMSEVFDSIKDES